MAAKPTHPAQALRGGLAVVGTLTLLAGFVLFLAPFLSVLLEIARTPEPDTRVESSVRIGATIFNTITYGTAISLLAGIVGLAPAVAMGHSQRGSVLLTSLALIPLLGPSYIAYSGWGLLRGPDTWLGDWLANQGVGWSIAAGRGMAVLGMVLWLWPIPALVFSMRLRRIDPAVRDLLTLDARGPLGRTLVLVRLLGPAIPLALALVGLVTLGSAVPLHVAAVPTYAIELWRVMQLGLSSRDTWVGAMPLLLVAACAAAILAWKLGSARPALGGEIAARGQSRRGWSLHVAAAVWACSVVVPWVLFLWSLRSWKSLWRFWSESGGALAGSAGVAGCVGVVVALLTLGTWACGSARGLAPPTRSSAVCRGAVWTVLLGSLFAGLTPGVLVGLAVGTLWNQPWLSRAGIGDSPAVVVLAHVARFGFIGVAAGLWLSRLESREDRATRELDAADSLRGWWLTRVPASWSGVIGIGLCAAALSIHEIESTVMVSPPGHRSIARTMLDFLHFSRDEQLSAAAANMLMVGTVVAGLGVGMIGLAARRARSSWSGTATPGRPGGSQVS